MKLLLDANLSARLLQQLSDRFPGSSHVAHVGLSAAEDLAVWEHARAHGFVVVTKDKDFQQLSALMGAPPKVVWLRVGNSSTKAIAELLRRHESLLREFVDNASKALLILAGGS